MYLFGINGLNKLAINFVHNFYLHVVRCSQILVLWRRSVVTCVMLNCVLKTVILFDLHISDCFLSRDRTEFEIGWFFCLTLKISGAVFPFLFRFVNVTVGRRKREKLQSLGSDVKSRWQIGLVNCWKALRRLGEAISWPFLPFFSLFPIHFRKWNSLLSKSGVSQISP